ncbi:YciI family protein [Kribbella sp. VKM Ac-2568]|uniref:YciI family protein n=1 Tax=Kribbella sp. VKM Ac-2568 TaxID=2512219 RepID=UPI0013053C38|nr:YciI family protein [Kribbella sp. VKM Ac-2568]
MAKFLVTYHGAGAPRNAEEQEQAMAAFIAWVNQVGSALVDPGAPLGSSAVVSSEGVADGVADGPAGGYSILEADDLAAAAELLRDHPFVGRGGALQVSQAISPA